MKVIHDASCKRDRFLKNYKQVLRAKTDYVVLKGSGGSGKSYGISQALVKKAAENYEKICVLRKVGSDIEESVWDNFTNPDERDGALAFWGFKEGKHYYTRKPSGKFKFGFIGATESVVIFRGVEDAERFKGINGVSILWIEEASEFSEEEFNIITDRIRGDKVQIILSFNPISEDHWLKKRFFDNPATNEDGTSRVTIIESTYRDNPYVGDKFRKDMDWYRVHDPDHYRVYGLGLWGAVKAKNPFVKNLNYNTMVKETKYIAGHDIYCAFDFNVRWTVSVKQKVWIPEKNGFEQRYIEFFRDEPEELIQKLLMKYGRSAINITGDASGNNRTQYTSDSSAKTAWLLVHKYLDIYGEQIYGISSYAKKFCDFSFIPDGANMGHNNSRMVMNALYAEWGERDLVRFDPEGCRDYLNECKTIEANAKGGLDKDKLNKEDKANLLDCGRYDCIYFEYEDFENLGLYQKQFKRAS